MKFIKRFSALILFIPAMLYCFGCLIAAALSWFLGSDKLSEKLENSGYRLLDNLLRWMD